MSGFYNEMNVEEETDMDKKIVVNENKTWWQKLKSFGKYMIDDFGDDHPLISACLLYGFLMFAIYPITFAGVKFSQWIGLIPTEE